MIDSLLSTMVIGQAAGQQNNLAFFGMMGMMILIFYFLIMRPQQKKQKEHQQMLDALKKGDKIITNGGFYGKITGLDESTVTLELADRVRVKIARSGIAGLAQPGK
ncbi:protein translocase subunit yajC [Desulfatibacillum alkenivorans DSM 16219]|uniref:Sec translocon accessory complex subunit YajC n=1 Tax=Desulfatibacillum alkenivorans DSM 16219 TaxID=1121393 RepID=A0A1M6PQE6_9BACT|nr:preprotein translocase subunit YajC [Desulfatibacillum alkenivorans]SHK10199.1 protein translocase subunit yajC [Desulfatibacillum alkenivorans DSM 16219]